VILFGLFFRPIKGNRSSQVYSDSVMVGWFAVLAALGSLYRQGTGGAGRG